MKGYKKLLFYILVFLGVVVTEFFLSYFLSRIGWEIVQPFDDSKFFGLPAFCLMGLVLILVEILIIFFAIRLFTKDKSILIIALLIAVIHYLVSFYGIIYCCCIYDS